MVHVVLAAFIGACLACLGTQSARGGGKIAAAGHQRRGGAAEQGAITVARDASGHWRDVGLLQAHCGAMVAGVGAGIAGVDTVLKTVGFHEGLQVA